MANKEEVDPITRAIWEMIYREANKGATIFVTPTKLMDRGRIFVIGVSIYGSGENWEALDTPKEP